MSDENKIFKIVEKVGESGLKIKLDRSDATPETIQISDTKKIKNEDGEGMLIKTDDGRNFGRLDSWPQDVLLEIH
ncbi:MAG: hypothetical protein ACE5EJ_03115 [Nitrosopumilaceae archaeon]